jgi:hypothetical protein
MEKLPGHRLRQLPRHYTREVSGSGVSAVYLSNSAKNYKHNFQKIDLVSEPSGNLNGLYNPVFMSNLSVSAIPNINSISLKRLFASSIKSSRSVMGPGSNIEPLMGINIRNDLL